MRPKTVETIIYYYRKKYNLKQQDICDGICSITTFSRIEQGERIVDSLVVENLLDRIGKEVELFEIILNNEDYELCKTRTTIQKELNTSNYDLANNLICDYRNLMPSESNVHRQFCSYCEILTYIGTKEERNFIFNKIKDALYITKRDYIIGTEQTSFYSKTEINLILMYLYYGNVEKSLAEKELNKILIFIEKYYSKSKLDSIAIQILKELIILQDKEKDSDKIISYANKAIEFIGYGNGIKDLAEMHFLKVKATVSKYSNSEQWETLKYECYEECKMAYYLYLIEEKHPKLEELQKYCQEILKCPTIKPGISFD